MAVAGYGSVDRYLGLSAATLGRFDEAEAHLANAVRGGSRDGRDGVRGARRARLGDARADARRTGRPSSARVERVAEAQRNGEQLGSVRIQRRAHALEAELAGAIPIRTRQVLDPSRDRPSAPEGSRTSAPARSAVARPTRTKDRRRSQGPRRNRSKNMRGFTRVSEAEELRRQRLLERRFREMGLEVGVLPGGRAIVATLPLGPLPFETPEGPRVLRAVRFYTIGHDRIKCMAPRALFHLPPIRVLDCEKIEEVEARIRSVWAQRARAAARRATLAGPTGRRRST